MIRANRQLTVGVFWTSLSGLIYKLISYYYMALKNTIQPDLSKQISQNKVSYGCASAREQITLWEKLDLTSPFVLCG